MLVQASERPAKLLSSAGVSSEFLNANDFMPFHQLVSIVRHAVDVEPSADWALRTGAMLGISSHGSLGFAALCAPDLGAGLKVFTDFAQIRAPYITLLGEARGDRYHIVLSEIIELGDLRVYLHEMIAMVIQSYIEQLLGHPMNEALISFAFARPKYYRSFKKYVNARCRFDEKNPTSISIPLSWTSLPSALADDALYRRSLSECRELYAQLSLAKDVTSRVSNLLAQHFDQVLSGTDADVAAPTINDIAGELNLTTRTLIRKLQREGSSFRELLEQHRKEAALLMLAKARYTIGEVASRLGYHDSANFSRAFKRWFKQTPAMYRRGV